MIHKLNMKSDQANVGIQSLVVDQTGSEKIPSVDISDRSKISRAQVELLRLFARHVVAELRRSLAD